MIGILTSIISVLTGIIAGLTLILLTPAKTTEQVGPIVTNSVETTEIILENPQTEEAPPINSQSKEDKEETTTNNTKKVETAPVVATSVKIEVAIEPPVVETSFIDLVTTTFLPEETTLGVSAVNTLARNATVNIICTSKQGGLLQPITGSGITIDSRGVILTNAHIGQYFLLKNHITNNFLECDIRTGSPAKKSYKAKLLYISPSWIKANYQKIASSNPRGTGEDDLALLLITDSTSAGTPLPSTFPYVTPDTRGMKPKIGENVIVSGYPAGFLGSASIQKELYAVSTVTGVTDVFTFGDNTLDLFSIGGNIAAQKGSSGGGVVSLEGGLLGVVVTASDATQTSERDLRAITLYHVNESIKKDAGVDLGSYLFGDLSTKANQFNELVVPDLTSLLEKALNQ